MNPIYEEDFLRFSYGFRPGRGPHDALDAVAVRIADRKVNWMLDADIRSFFDTVSQPRFIRFVEHRLGFGDLTAAGQHPPHYVFDLRAERWRLEACGDMIIVRYADDLVTGFEHEADARRFLDAMRRRLEEFSQSLEVWRRTLPAARPEAPSDFAADRQADRRPQVAYPSPLARPALRRQTPEVGAVCGKAAQSRTCGARSVVGVPTASPKGSETDIPEAAPAMGLAPPWDRLRL